MNKKCDFSPEKFAIWYWSIGIVVAITVSIWMGIYTKDFTIEQNAIFNRDFFAYGVMIVSLIGIVSISVALLFGKWIRGKFVK